MALFDDVPASSFRLPHGYKFDAQLEVPDASADHLAIGRTDPTGAQDCLFLGKLAEYERMKTNVWLDTVGAHAIYVMGKRRSGKTFTLGVLAEGLAGTGWTTQGNPTQGVLILDTMNVFLTMPFAVREVHGPDHPLVRDLERWQLPGAGPSVNLFRPAGTPAPPGLPSSEISLRTGDITAEEWNNLFDIDSYADPMGHLMMQLYEKVTTDGYQGSTDPVAPNPDYTLSDLLDCLQHDPDVGRYDDRTVEAVRRRLSAMSHLSIFAQPGSEIRTLLAPGAVNILLLRDIEHRLRSLLIGLIVKKVMELRSESDRFERMAQVHRARYESGQGDDSDQQRAQEYQQQAAQGLPRSWLLIDEAHNYVPSRGVVPSKSHIRRYVNEGRNLGLSIVVATQQPSGLDQSIQRNADMLVIHAMSIRDDIQAAEGMLNTLVPDSYVRDGTRVTGRVFDQTVRSLPQGYAVVSSDQANRIFPVLVRPRVTLHGGREY